ncbi:MAG: S1C family serine protease [Clostridiales bacterium]|jgi:serine protease Do|nr:S1C family serine protease [Clostridiales bacterium]
MREIKEKEKCSMENSEYEYEKGNENFIPAIVKNKKKTKKKFKATFAVVTIGILNVVVMVWIYGFGYLYGKNSFKKNSKVNIIEKINDSVRKEEKKILGDFGELSTSEIAKKAGPCVVGITTNITKNMGFWGEYELEGCGSGIILDVEGYIITNNHVVEGANKVMVTLNTGEPIEAKIVGTDSKMDIAVIKIETDLSITPAELGDSSELEVGEKAIAIGNPFGLEFAGSVTQGVISAVDRKIKCEGNKELNVVQTDASINNGNSGGPLLNRKGQVIGINTIKFSPAHGFEGMGFAIPINSVKPVIIDLIEHGHVKGRPTIGISIRNLTKSIAEQQSWPLGVQVMYVKTGSGAEIAGLKRGDIITKCSGIVVATIDEINKIKDKLFPGDVLEFEVYKYETGKTETVKVKLMEEKNDK